MKFYISVFLSVLSPRLWQEMWGFFWKLEGTRHQSPLRDCLIHTVGCPAVRWLCCRAKESGISLVSCSYPESLALPPSLPTSSPRELSDPSFQSSVKGCFLGCPPGSGVQIPALLLVPAFCSCVPWETTCVPWETSLHGPFPHHHWRPRLSSWFPASAWPSRSCRGYLGSASRDRSSLCVSLIACHIN